jgi:peptidoglycan/xylan/chitin deacetylase (PgdA/CDA1 family)
MNTGIDVVICIVDGTEPSRETIHALTREVGTERRVVRGTSIWQARQNALDSSTADVIAFVDRDVVVDDGWLDALRMAWEASPHSIGAIGGPIRAAAPEWARGRLGLIDLGNEVLELDPAERTLFAGNLSFWRRALAGVGGFAAPVDGRDATDWLSEEHEAQRQLGHWGWLIRYAPGMAAERRIETDEPLRRAYRYGVRTGIAGSRPRSVALKQGAKSAAGAAAALARGRRAEASERAARVAENLGVLATPVGYRQPHSEARGLIPNRDVRGHAAPAGSAPSVDVVLLYHRFAAGEPDPLGLCVSPERFEAQLRVLRDGFEVVPLAHIASRVRLGEAGSGRVAITIDDGYLDNLTTGVPLIAEAGLPATLFAATGHIETGRRFFWDEMERLLTGPGSRPDVLELEGRRWPTKTPDQRELARQELHRLTQPRSLEQIEQTLTQLRDWAGAAAGEPAESTRPVTVDELKQLAQTPNLEVGAHTRDHVNLAHRDAADLREQIERSREDVAGWTGTRPAAFSYPFGIPRHDVNDEARDAVAVAGFEYAVVNQPVPVEAGADVFGLPRVFAPDAGRDEFAGWLRGLLD